MSRNRVTGFSIKGGDKGQCESLQSGTRPCECFIEAVWPMMQAYTIPLSFFQQSEVFVDVVNETQV